MDVFDCAQQFVPRGLLQEVAGSACRERIVDVVGVLVDGEHDELRFGQRAV